MCSHRPKVNQYSMQHLFSRCFLITTHSRFHKWWLAVSFFQNLLTYSYSSSGRPTYSVSMDSRKQRIWRKAVENLLHQNKRAENPNKLFTPNHQIWRETKTNGVQGYGWKPRWLITHIELIVFCTLLSQYVIYIYIYICVNVSYIYVYHHLCICIYIIIYIYIYVCIFFLGPSYTKQPGFWFLLNYLLSFDNDKSKSSQPPPQKKKHTGTTMDIAQNLRTPKENHEMLHVHLSYVQPFWGGVR